MSNFTKGSIWLPDADFFWIVPWFIDFDKCVHNITNILFTHTHKKKTSSRSIDYKVHTVISNKIAISNVDDKEIQDEDRITTYPYRSNISYIKHFSDKKYLILFNN